MFSLPFLLRSITTASSALFFAAFWIALPVAPAHSEDQRCVDLVKECFAYLKSDRDTCFKAVSKHSFCAGSLIAPLATKRWELSPLLPSGVEMGPAFLGPQLVDQACLANFDNTWSAALVQGNISADAVGTLTTTLSSCAKVPASEIVHP